MNLTTPRVIILWKDEDVLLSAIELLLKTKAGWQVVRFADDWEENSLLQIVDELHPDVFIVHEDIFTEKMHLFTKFALEYSKLKILTLSLENNLVNIYNRCTFSIKEVTDLFSIIEDDIPMN
jgi:DNA-binding NarL/FixJ family response regulator